MKRMITLIFCLLIVISPVGVFANSAMTYWVGVDAQGVVTNNQDCPIVVEHEELILDIQELPSLDYDTTEEFLAYSPTATAKYTFYNPSDYTVTAKLLFPYGFSPDYTSDHGVVVDAQKYGAAVDGVPVETTRRVTLELPYSNSEFVLDDELPRLVDGYRSHEFYAPDMMVTKYVFTARDVNFDDYKPFGRITLNVDPMTTRYLFSYGYFHNGIRSVNNGDSFIQNDVWLEPGYTTELYMIGTQTELPNWEIFDGKEKERPIDGAMDLVETQTMTLEEMIMAYYPAEYGISKSDWYNAVLDSFDRYSQENGQTSSELLRGDDVDIRLFLLNWYEYEITLEPGQRIENTVTVPFYPDIDEDYEPAVYNYTYLLSPASTWADFGTLDITVHTPFHLIGESTVELEKTADGYAASLDGLPEGELEFTLCTAEDPEEPKLDLSMLMWTIAVLPAYLVVHYWWLILLILLGIYVIRQMSKE